MFSNELLGCVAGGIVMLASVPQLIKNFIEPNLAQSISKQRQLLIIGGNAAWVLYGILEDAEALTITALINVVLNAVLLYQTLTSKKNTGDSDE